MNNFDNDMKEFFNKKMSGLLPSEELKNKIMYDIKEEEKKKSILDKIRNLSSLCANPYFFKSTVPLTTSIPSASSSFFCILQGENST